MSEAMCGTSPGVAEFIIGRALRDPLAHPGYKLPRLLADEIDDQVDRLDGSGAGRIQHNEGVRLALELPQRDFRRLWCKRRRTGRAYRG